MKPNSEVSLSDFSLLGNDLNEIRETLRIYAENNTKLTYKDIAIDAMMLLQFFEYVLYMNQQRMKKYQHVGIEKALQRKSEGIGHYGRPKAMLPKDFDEQIKNRIRNKQSLADYCDEVHMKKSTFYRYAKSVKKSIKG